MPEDYTPPEVYDRYAEFLWAIGRAPKTKEGKVVVSRRMLEWMEKNDNR
jgi:hypothetical protein